MRRPTGDRLIRVWEWGQDKDPVDQALALLAEAMPDTDRGALAQRTVAERDGLLLELRVLLFGPKLEVKSACPECGSEYEFAVDAEMLRAPFPSSGPHTLEVDGWAVEFRLPTSVDLVAAASADTPAAGRHTLVGRCLLTVRGPDGAPVAEAPPNVVAAVAEQMRELSPQTDIRFRLDCTDCATAWRTALAIGPFLWTEFDAEARRLLTETHALALRYGWSEDEVLRMSPQRRKYYLDLSR